MAAGSLDAPCVNTTSGLLAELDLNKRPSTNNMEAIDFDPEIVVLDTPDRLAAKQTHCGDLVEENGSLSVVVISRNDNLWKDGNLNSRGRLVNGDGRNRRLHFSSRKNLKGDSSNSSALDSSPTSKHSHFSGVVAEEVFKHEDGQPNGAIFSNKGKGLSTTSPSESSWLNDKSFLDLTVSRSPILGKSHLHNASDNSEERKGPRKTTCLSVDNITNFSTRSSNSWKGKEKMDDNIVAGTGVDKGKANNISGDPKPKQEKMEDNIVAGTGVDKGKAYNISGDPEPKQEKVLSASIQSSMPSRVTGKKKLVRNGCISPYNIAKAAELTQRNSKDFKDAEAEWRDSCKSEPIDLSHGVISRTSGSGGIYLNRAKEKGVQIQPKPSKDHEAGNTNTSGCILTSQEERAKRANIVTEDAARCNEELAGWLSTRNCSKPKFSHLEKRDEMIIGKNRNGNHHHEIPDTDCQLAVAVLAAQALTSSSRSMFQGANQCHRVENGFTKRQKKHGSTLSNAECSTSASDDTEIFCLGSSGEPSSSRLTRNLDNNHRRNLDSVIEIDELSPEVKCLGARGAHGSNDDINARARQVEADEMLARELQEQLYHEGPTLLDGEMDAQLAWMLQGQEEEHQALSVSHHYDEDIARMLQRSLDVLEQPSRRGHASVDPGGSLASDLISSWVCQNPSVQRRLQARVAPSTRMSQLRNRLAYSSPLVAPRERNFHFPSNMDVNTRMHVLEELESAVGDHSDAGAIGQLLRLQRDFNENDYEMLLALDENNHRHVGASSNQINSLPQSTVQTDNFEEVCTICLETPNTGDIIRHLPCLHKFHKDCIDPWLRRKTSCPVCKSSVT